MEELGIYFKIFWLENPFVNKRPPLLIEVSYEYYAAGKGVDRKTNSDKDGITDCMLSLVWIHIDILVAHTGFG